ncbi:hypothetical protein RIF29_06752 [Crotalaria pallida]|uniref:Uncharacterized protein n=1 Tax=Crotalaria pallida TaxID=3830 RepID=A0AAN9PAH5_CROPI
MGGGNSKLKAGDGVVVPDKIRPLLLRRFEELRKRRNGATLQVEGTLSQKQLLKDAHEDEGSNNSQVSSHETETETETQQHDTEKEKTDEAEKVQVKEEIQMIVRVISIEKISRLVPMPNCECKCKSEEQEEEEEEEKETKTEHHDNQKVFHIDKVAEVHEEEKTKENEQEEIHAKIDDQSDEDEDEDDDDDNHYENEQNGRVGPGSPSFRIYCIEADNRKDSKEDEESKNETIVVHKKSASADSIQSSTSRRSGNSNEVIQVVEIESTRKRKGKKKFGAVRTLLKVKSCYHPMSSCTGEDRRRLLVAKATH